ncbi:amino acid ABC transporter substrate-binding protein [Psychromonas hadalis]|uniref:amino acid ABC transporter substrate-binding protein n=1 Tax=Psychromonas hadalis TaxID=211669 RepID=UPI0003B35636
MKKILKLSLIAIAVIGMNVNAGTFEKVKKEGVLHCGMSTGFAGFAEMGDDKVWKGFDIDMCRAVAAAVLGDANKLNNHSLTSKERFIALQTGEIDMLARSTTWTYSRDTSLGLNFAGVNYYDGQGFLVAKSLGVKDARELDGATFCLQTGNTTELNLADYFLQHNMEYKSVSYDTDAQVIAGFKAGRCDAITTDQSGLYSKLTVLDKSKYIVLPNIISKEPLGPVVRQGDDRWFNIVKWSLNAMITAEELGITSKNAADLAKNSNNPEIQRLLGVNGNLGEMLGLDAKWAYNIITQVGNYSESFEKHLGVNTPLDIKRGINALWTNGGILYSPPFR